MAVGHFRAGHFRAGHFCADISAPGHFRARTFPRRDISAPGHFSAGTFQRQNTYLKSSLNPPKVLEICQKTLKSTTIRKFDRFQCSKIVIDYARELQKM